MKKTQLYNKLLGVSLIALLSVSVFSATAFADVINPRQQMHLNFTAEQVICSENLVKVIKASSGSAACVKPTTAEKLAKSGWAKQLTEQKLDEIITKKTSDGEPAGTIKKIATLKQLAKNIKAGTSTSISGYAYVFEVCAEAEEIRTPEIIVTSDSETKNVKLGSMLKANSCYASSALIKASDPKSISATLLNTGGISEKIESLETQIADLKDKISTAKQNIPKSADQSPKQENLDSITSMKKSLKNLQDQLRRYLMVLYVPPNVKAIDIDIPKSLTGKPLEGMSADLISVTESVVKPESDNSNLKRFNVVFEVCAGKETVRLAIIEVVSDSESVSVKLINRIIPESCQVGIAKINALDSESIIPKISGNSAASNVILDLEKQINDLQTALSDQRHELQQLPFGKQDSLAKERAAQIALNIAELRAELLEKRVKLNGLMLEI